MTSEPELASAPEETPTKVPAKVATVVTLSLGNAIALSDPALVSSRAGRTSFSQGRVFA